eukprot:3723566-Ditylum_brightwellii.AAC.1
MEMTTLHYCHCPIHAYQAELEPKETDNNGNIENVEHAGDGIVNDGKPSLYSAVLTGDQPDDATVEMSGTAYNSNIDSDYKDEEELDILHENKEYIDEEEESESIDPFHM